MRYETDLSELDMKLLKQIADEEGRSVQRQSKIYYCLKKAWAKKRKKLNPTYYAVLFAWHTIRCYPKLKWAKRNH